MTEEDKQDIIEQLKKGAKRYTCCCVETFSKMCNFRKFGHRLLFSAFKVLCN